MAARRPPASLNAVETGVDITRQPSFVRAWQRRHRSQQRGRAQKWCNKFDLASSLLVSMPIVYEETPDGHVSLIDCGHPMEWQHGTAARVLHEHVHVAVASFHNPAVQRTFCSRPRMVSSSVNKTIEFLQQVAFGSDSDRGACNYMEDRHYAEVVTNADMFLGRDAEWTPPSSDKLQKDRPPVQRAARLSNSGDGHAHAADLMTPRTLDYLSLVFPHAFFAVFDGHAGETAAEYVKATLHRHILQTLYMTHDVVTAIRQGHILTDLRLLAEAKRLSEEERNDDKAQSGSTAVSVLLHGRSMFIANVGDSRAVLGRLRPPARACSEPNVSGPSAGGTGGTETARPTMRSFSDGPLLPASASAKAPSSLDALLTKMGGSAASTPVSRTPLPTNSNRSKFEAVSLSWDQNVWRQDEVRRVVDECGGVIKGEGSHARVGGYVQVTRAFGDYDVYSSEKIKGLSSEPEVHHCVVQPDLDAFLVLASDGLWDVLSDQEVVDKVGEYYSTRFDEKGKNKREKEIAGDLVEFAAVTKKTEDNVCAIVVTLNSNLIMTHCKPPERPERPRRFFRGPSSTPVTPSATASPVGQPDQLKAAPSLALNVSVN